ncbi:MAG: diguanylate cyclase [Anaerolineales bacterium]
MPQKILVVDDSRQMRDFFADSVLRPAGYEVALAADGLAGLRKAHEFQPDLVIADLQMPGLTGLQLRRELVKAGLTMPLILVTAEGSEDIASQATLAGVASYLPKPVDIDVMLAAVAQALNIELLRRERAEAMSALEVRVRQLEVLQRNGRDLTASLDLSAILTKLLQAALTLTGADSGSMFLLDEPGGSLRRRAARDPADAAVRAVLEPAQDQLAAYVVRTGKPIIYGPPPTGTLKGAPANPVLYLPLRQRDHTLGVLAVERRLHNWPFNEADVGPLTILADYGAVAIANARLFAEVQLASITDGLTGLYNRRQLMMLAEREFQRTRRFQRPLSAIMLDIDHFKQVNDSYGHAAGDQVIAEVARRIAANVRTVDLPGRYGGEEFVLLLPETALPGAGLLAERLRQAIGSSAIPTVAGPLPVTASLGVATDAADVTNAASLISRADAALYAAKEGGRNRSSAYGIAG